MSQTFAVGGWAVDTSSSSGTGIAGVSVIATPDGGSGTGYSSTYGGSRPDVGNYFEDSRFTPSGWGATLTLSPGGYWLSFYPLSTVTGTFGPPVVIHVTVQ